MGTYFDALQGSLDLGQDLSGYVPYTGAVSDLDLGVYKAVAARFQTANLDLTGSTVQSVVAPLYLSAGTTGLYIQFNGSTVAYADSSFQFNVVKTLVIGDGVSDASAIFQDEQTVNAATVKPDKLSGGSYTALLPATNGVGGSFILGDVPSSGNILYGKGNNVVTSSKNFQYTEGGGVSSLLLGGAGFDGELKLYSEQGATDRTLTIRPNTTMTADSTFYFPAAVPGGTRAVTMTSGGVMGYLAGTANRVLFFSSTDTVGSDADFTFSVDTLTVTKIAATTYTGLQTYADAVNLAFNTTTGSKIGTGSTQKIGFWNATPVVQPSAYTQTYSTASRTVNAYTTDAESSAYSGIDNLQVGSVYAQVSDLNALRVAYENLRASYDNLIQVVNSLIDDHQATGLCA